MKIKATQGAFGELNEGPVGAMDTHESLDSCVHGDALIETDQDEQKSVCNGGRIVSNGTESWDVSNHGRLLSTTIGVDLETMVAQAVINEEKRFVKTEAEL